MVVDSQHVHWPLSAASAQSLFARAFTHVAVLVEVGLRAVHGIGLPELGLEGQRQVGNQVLMVDKEVDIG